MPMVAADSCSITNLGDCLPEAFFNYVLDIINTPLEILLGLIKGLLAEAIDPSAFSEVWAIVVYIISMFYGLLLLWSGLNFIISGYNFERRENAKEWLKNILLMVFLVQASYLLYVMLLDVNTSLTTAIFNLISEDFFIFTIDSFSEVANELMYGSVYLLVLLCTIVILTIRFIIVSFGVALFPIGIFMYFIQPLRGFGKALLNFLFINIFISFFASLIFLVGSVLLDTSLFADTKMLLMIATFLLVDVLLVYFLLYGLVMGALKMTLSWKTFGLLKILNRK